MKLGRFGVWTSYRLIGEENAGEVARLVEALGFDAFWLGGSPQLPALRALLEATERIVVGDRDPRRWQNEPERVAAEFAELSERFPDRVLLGIGIGHPEATSQYAKPRQAMRAFLDGLDAASTPVRAIGAVSPRWGPKMLDSERRALVGRAHLLRRSRAHPHRTRPRPALGSPRSSPARSGAIPSPDEPGRVRTRSCTSGCATTTRTS